MKSSPIESLKFQIGNMEYEEYLANYLLWCAFFVAMVIVLISFVTISLFASSLWVEVTNLIKAQLPSFVSNFEDFIYRNRDVVGEKHFFIENFESHLKFCLFRVVSTTIESCSVDWWKSRHWVARIEKTAAMRDNSDFG